MNSAAKFSHAQKMVSYLFVAGVCLSLLACKPSKFNKRSGSLSPANSTNAEEDKKEKDGEASSESIKLLSDDEAMDYFKGECMSCHGADVNGKPGVNYSQWPLDGDQLTRDAFDLSLYAPIVYQTLKNKLSGASDTMPKPMPFSSAKVTDAQKIKLKNILGWFHVNLPLVVSEAEQLYGGDTQNTEEFDLNFSCETPIALRSYLKRWSLAAFDRSPNTAEMKLFSDSELNNSVSVAQREMLTAYLFDEEKGFGEFKETGLAKLAAVIGGAPAIQKSEEITAEVTVDLKKEFHELFKEKFSDWKIDDYFTSDQVMVSKLTAPLYGCGFVDEGAAWQSCEMPAPRSGFFTTLGFLNSKRSSYLIENNNYGRVALIYFTLGGQGLAAAVNGPKGDGQVAALPDCLEETDTRTVAGAARGSAAIPLAGDICQSCHISRNLAAGSVLFRPFSMDGMVIPGGVDNAPLDKFFADLDLNEWEYADANAEVKPVDVAFLKALVSDPVKACSINPVSQKQTLHKNVNDLAKYLMTNKKLILRGFMRHAQRAYLNSQSLNFELVYEAVKQAEKGEMKLPDLLKIYFQSESFACEAK